MCPSNAVLFGVLSSATQIKLCYPSWSVSEYIRPWAQATLQLVYLQNYWNVQKIVCQPTQYIKLKQKQNNDIIEH